MLDALRNRAGSWVAKIFIGLLAASFAVWGVSDVFRGYRADVLVKVGDLEITAEDYRTAFNRQLRAYSRQLGQNLTPDQARQLGLDRQVLSELIRDAALAAQADALGLAVPDQAVAQRIAASPEFQNPQGDFDPARFRLWLASTGMSEQQIVRDVRLSMIRGAIAEAVDNALTAPLPLVEAVWKYRNEQRDVAYFVVRSDEADIADPSDQELKEFYETNQALFTAPERRSFVAINADPAELGARIDITEEEISATYERHQEEFGTPERRVIQQIPFTDVEEARAAFERIRSGTDFLDIAREKGLSEADATLGELTRAGVPDPALAEVAFGLGQGEVSEPVEARLSTVLLRVTKITPGSQKSRAEARDEILKRLQTERGQDEALNIHDRVEDGRAAGQSFEEIAATLGLTLLTFEDIDRSGLGPDGKAAVDLPAKEEVLRTVFESDIGIEADPIATPDDGFVWVDVREITPSAMKPFEAVQEEAAAAWKKRKLRDAVLERAREIKKQAESGTPFDELAQGIGAEVRTIQNVKRGEATEAFDAVAVAALFAAPPDGYAVAPEADGKGAKVMKSSPVLLPPFDANSEDAKAVANALQSGLAGDLASQYLTGLQANVGVELNEALWSRVSGGGS